MLEKGVYKIDDCIVVDPELSYYTLKIDSRTDYAILEIAIIGSGAEESRFKGQLDGAITKFKIKVDKKFDADKDLQKVLDKALEIKIRDTD